MADANQVATLRDYIALGYFAEAMRNMRLGSLDQFSKYDQTHTNFVKVLERSQLKRAAAAAKDINDMVKGYESEFRSNPTQFFHKVQEFDTLVRNRMGQIVQDMANEADEHDIRVTDKKDLPYVLQDLEARMGVTNLKDHQKALREDVLNCLRAQSWRAAIVMGWALGYDLLRYWVYENTDRRKEFNGLLAKRTKKADENGRSITKYEDFFEEKESLVLQICRDGQGALAPFTDTTHDHLKSLLRDRNRYAHANYAEATAEEARSFIDRLFRYLAEDLFSKT